MVLVTYLNQTRPWRSKGLLSLFPESEEQSRISRKNVGSVSTNINLPFLEIPLEERILTLMFTTHRADVRLGR